MLKYQNEIQSFEKQLIVQNYAPRTIACYKNCISKYGLLGSRLVKN